MPKTKPAQAAPEWASALTARERVFVAHCVVTLNGTRAALAAGYGRGTNANVANRQAGRLLAKPRVTEAINRLVQERSGVTPSLVLQKLDAIATMDITDVAEGPRRPVDRQGHVRAIARGVGCHPGYEVNDRGYLNVKLRDRIPALDLLSKILGMKRSVNARHPASRSTSKSTTRPRAALALWRA